MGCFHGSPSICINASFHSPPRISILIDEACKAIRKTRQTYQIFRRFQSQSYPCNDTRNYPYHNWCTVEQYSKSLDHSFYFLSLWLTTKDNFYTSWFVRIEIKQVPVPVQCVLQIRVQPLRMMHAILALNQKFLGDHHRHGPRQSLSEK